MKFKLIFGLFNVIILIAFLFVFFMPIFVIGIDPTLDFWVKNWYIAILFLVVLAGLDSYFIRNWRLFDLLEKEDWQKLSEHLHTQIYDKGATNEQNIRMLCNALVILGKSQAIKDLEQFLRNRKPMLVQKHAVLLGLPYLIDHDGQALVTFFEPMAADSKLKDIAWIKFFYVFGLMSNARMEEARPLVKELCLQTQDRVVQLVAMYLVSSTIDEGDIELVAARNAFKTQIKLDSCTKMIEQGKDLMHIVLLAKIMLYPARDWMYEIASPVQ